MRKYVIPILIIIAAGCLLFSRIYSSRRQERYLNALEADYKVLEARVYDTRSLPISIPEDAYSSYKYKIRMLTDGHSDLREDSPSLRDKSIISASGWELLDMITPDDPYIKKLSLLITEGLNTEEARSRAIDGFVKKFIYYKTDRWENPKYPVETLVDRNGDCEDIAVLTASLMKVAGIKTALILFTREGAIGHLSCGVKLKDSGRYEPCDSVAIIRKYEDSAVYPVE